MKEEHHGSSLTIQEQPLNIIVFENRSNSFFQERNSFTIPAFAIGLRIVAGHNREVPVRQCKRQKQIRERIGEFTKKYFGIEPFEGFKGNSNFTWRVSYDREESVQSECLSTSVDSIEWLWPFVGTDQFKVDQSFKATFHCIADEPE